MGPPADLWALYPTPPASVIDEDNALFGLPLMSFDKSELFTGLGSNFATSFDEQSIFTL